MRFGWSHSNCEDQEMIPFFVNPRTSETTREGLRSPLSEDGSVLGGFRITWLLLPCLTSKPNMESRFGAKKFPLRSPENPVSY
jgi:hypothetical protein